MFFNVSANSKVWASAEDVTNCGVCYIYITHPFLAAHFLAGQSPPLTTSPTISLGVQLRAYRNPYLPFPVISEKEIHNAVS